MVYVVGAGVVGLTTALELQHQYPNLDVTIVAESFNDQTTSDGAAGLLLPSSNFLGPDLETTKVWMKDSYEYYNNLKSEECSNIRVISGYTMSNYSQDAAENHYMKLVCPDYRPLKDDELDHFDGAIKYGSYMTTMVIPCRKLLPYYMEKFTQNGGRVVKKKLMDFSELKNEFNVIFNCSGLGAQLLCNDIEVTPIRGQIAQVHAPWVDKFYSLESITYIIPCGYNNLVTLGGTQDYSCYEREINLYDHLSIMDRCTSILPRLKSAPLKRQWVGLRPYRSRVRVEVEESNNYKIIHNYGHGGYGVTTAPGSSKYAINLFKLSHISKSKF